MTVHSESRLLRSLQTAGLIVVIAWGVAKASHLISILLLSLLLAFSVLPLPKWIMRRFKMGKSAAVALTVTLLGVAYLTISAYLANAAYRLTARLPAYQERLQQEYGRIVPFLVSHGVQSANLSLESLFSPERLAEYARVIIPSALGSLSDLLLISLLSLLFVIEMAEEPARQSRPVAMLILYGQDVRQFIAVSAKTGALTAVANLALLAIVGVEFPLLWCVLYFFLQFIPNLGSIAALIPPALLALLMFGWQKALIVAAGMIVTNLVAANVLNPIFLKKSVSITFLEIALSLIVWGALLGFWGSVVAIPLTLVLKRIVERSADEQAARSFTTSG